ncbi:MAG: hypothetical protein A2W25_04280 [candidate division Zixibacteria bacterium RBG_16_53_22]|nr:MAG: hypothetical protein A2W25_04280 [candidate division Zixibacteria bacterium RBG_16_53_22]
MITGDPVKPEARFLGPEQLGQYLAQKDWREALYILPGKDDDGRVTPVARFLGGKVVLFPYEYHSTVRPGETWECQIIEDYPTYMKATPLRKISGIKVDKDAMPPMPPVLARVFVDAIKAKMDALGPPIEALEEEQAKLDEEADRLTEELASVNKRLEELADDLEEKKSDIATYQKALDQYGPQCESEQDMGDHPDSF